MAKDSGFQGYVWGLEFWLFGIGSRVEGGGQLYRTSHPAGFSDRSIIFLALIKNSIFQNHVIDRHLDQISDRSIIFLLLIKD